LAEQRESQGNEREKREGRRKKNQVAMLFKIACVLPH